MDPLSPSAAVVTGIDAWVVRELGGEIARAARGSGELSAEELARADRYRHETSRDTFLVTRWAARAILGEVIGVPPSDVDLRNDANGRPIVEGAPARIRISLSHTDGCALVAVAVGHEVGIDVEPLDRCVERGLADRVCTAAERRDLALTPTEGWSAAFLRLWVRKEAVVKADGRGLRLALDTVEVRETPVGLEAQAAPVHVVDLELGPDHVAAVAALGAVPRVRLHPWRVP